jgi:ligand-binding sensor domain-containing protein
MKTGREHFGFGTGYPGAGKPEEGGLNRMNKKTGTFNRYLNIPGNIHSLANNKVRAIFEDNQGVLWIGTGGNGLHKMDRKQGTFERIVYDPAHPEKISGPAFKKESSTNEVITFITQDAAGSYWIGTLEGGLNYYNPVIGKTIHYPGTENSAGFNDKGTWWHLHPAMVFFGSAVIGHGEIFTALILFEGKSLIM